METKKDCVYCGKILSLPKVVFDTLGEKEEMFSQWLQENVDIPGIIKEGEDFFEGSAIFPADGIVENYVTYNIDNENQLLHSRLSGDEIQKSQENIAKEISKGHEFVATAKPLIRIPFIKR